MFLGGKFRASSFAVALGATVLTSSCSDRFKQEDDPLAQYYASRPRYREPAPVPTPKVSNHQAHQVQVGPPPSEAPVPNLVSSPENTLPDVVGHAHDVSVLPDGTTHPLGLPAPLPPSGGGPVVAHGGGAYKDFPSEESAQIRDNIFGGKKIAQFDGFEALVERMMDFKHFPTPLTTVSQKSETLVKGNFDMNEKAFCEDFSLGDLKFSGKGRWAGANGQNALAEMKRVNQAHNQILHDYKSAVAAHDDDKAKQLSEENLAYWKIFMSCLSYSESGTYWKHPNSVDWHSGWNDYGVYQLNPAQKSGGNLNDCSENWNTEFPEQAVDQNKFFTSAAYRKSIVTTSNQHFNIFCGLSKVQQNLAHQAYRNEGCLNPFKKSYNHFGALTEHSDLNFLRCTSKLLPSANGVRSPTDALEALRTSDSGTRSPADAKSGH